MRIFADLSYRSIAPFIAVALACLFLSGLAMAAQPEKVERPGAVNNLPFIRWAEEIPDRSRVDGWVYSAMAYGEQQDYVDCTSREFLSDCDPSEFLLVAPRTQYDYLERLHAVYKIRGAHRWNFLRWVSIPREERYSTDYVVFDVERVLNGVKKTMRYAANHESIKELDPARYPTLEKAIPLKRTTGYDPSVKGDSRVKESNTQSIKLVWMEQGENTRLVFSISHYELMLSSSYEVTLQGKWSFFTWAAEDLTGDKDNYSILRIEEKLPHNADRRRAVVEVLINPWEAYIKPGHMQPGSDEASAANQQFTIIK